MGDPETMKTHNADNKHIKRRYLTFLKEAKRQSEASLDAVPLAACARDVAERRKIPQNT
jgi:hypothetical protein